MALTILVFVLIGNTFWLFVSAATAIIEEVRERTAFLYAFLAVAGITAVNAVAGALAHFLITHVGALS
jgi:precorrin-2 methylase